MKSLHYQAGYLAAKNGEFRAAPSQLKIVTTPWRDWYAGFDAAVSGEKHPNMDANFSLRSNSAQYEASI